MRRLLLASTFALAALACIAGGARAQIGPTLAGVDWHKTTSATGTPIVRFHLQWSNPAQTGSSVPVSGSIGSQEFGVYQPQFGSIGQFQVPALAPAGFFDVFFDVALTALPPEPQVILPTGNSPGAVSLHGGRTQRPTSNNGPPCQPDTIWAGNVDVVWSGAGVSGFFQRHYAELPVCPGGAPTYIHVKSTNCPVGAPWSVTGLCPGFTATLVNEDKSPAPNPVPPGWTGFIQLGAGAVVGPGTTCCPILKFTCQDAPAQIELCVTACDCANTGPTLGQVDWHTVGTNQHFHLRFANPSPTLPTGPVSGQLMSQMFGVFQPDYGPIGQFDVPSLAPAGFFDIFLDVPISQLPPEPLKILPGSVASGPAGARFASAFGVMGGGVPTTCSSDTIWDGNVDVTWSGTGGSGQVNRHYGQLIVCPGGAPSYIHIPLLNCAAPVTWSVSGLCPGFGVTLVNEDKSAAPNPVPVGWSGFIAITATAAVVPGTVCCPVLTFNCAGTNAKIELCATACDCGNRGPTPGQIDWHDINPSTERFHVRWVNPSPTGFTVPVSGAMMSQPFGVFLSDVGQIGPFSVPALAPASFFDVFVDVPITSLPPAPQRHTPGTPTAGLPCLADTIWNGNLDVAWGGTGVTGQVQRHYGDLIVCPGTDPSLIHVSGVGCAVGATWSVNALCPGFVARLVNEDFTLAPNPLPAGWTGWVAVTAAAGTAPGTVCCFTLDFTCAGAPAEIQLCVTACDCGLASVRGDEADLGFGIRATVPNPTSGVASIVFALPHDTQSRLELYDASGRRVRTLAGGLLAAGRHVAVWDGRDGNGESLPRGEYFVRLSIAGRVATGRITLVR